MGLHLKYCKNVILACCPATGSTPLLEVRRRERRRVDRSVHRVVKGGGRQVLELRDKNIVSEREAQMSRSLSSYPSAPITTQLKQKEMTITQNMR